MPPSWIEILPSFDCNCRCLGCTGTVLPSAARMGTADVAAWLVEGRRRRIGGVWFGGGEPTLRPDLINLVAHARSLGYRRIRVQTNGIRFSYPAFVRASLDAGVTEVSVSVKGVDARAHDAMTRVRGSFKAMTDGVRALVAAGARVDADVMITTRSMPHLARIVSDFTARGVRAFVFWLFSRYGFPRDELRDLVPDMREAARAMEAAFDKAVSLGVEASSLHTPPCVLRPAFRKFCRHAGDWNVLVVQPGGRPFMAAESPIDAGPFLPDCSECSLRARCLGPRADYVALRGEAAFVPVARSPRTGRSRASKR